MAEPSQNIFDYATSELSQDAFISLLIAWFKSDDEKLREISIDFISSLYREYVIRKFRWSASEKDFIYSLYKKHELDMKLEIKSVEIKQQHFKIDVYFEAMDISGKKIIPFIIEDKTWTEPHSNQLKEYVEKVSNKKNKKYSVDDIVKIFFKTGHITEKDECATKDAGYIILDTLWIYDFLEKHSPDHAIYKDYKDYLKRNFYDKLYDKRIKKELKDWKYDDVKEGYVQYALIKYIKNDLRNNDRIRFTRNGKLWTTWMVFYETEEYKLFVKIVKIDSKYRIRLIEYSKKDIDPSRKEITLTENIDICKKLIQKDDSFGKIIVKYKGYYEIKTGNKKGKLVTESEIANLDLNNNLSLVQNAQLFSKFMKEFLQRTKI